MNTFELKIWNDECLRCTFYTVHEDGKEESETDDFFIRFENDTDLENELIELHTFIIEAIGNRHGAIDALFNRDENEVTGLPNHGKRTLEEFTYHYPKFPLRLYALRVSEEIVILFNGGIKDGPTNQTSSCQHTWREACSYAKRIIDALNSKDIVVDTYKRSLLNFKGGEEIII